MANQMSMHVKYISYGQVCEADVYDLGEFAQSHRSDMTHIELPEGLRSLDEGTFWDCRALESVKLPSSLVSMGLGTFQDCTSLKSVELPDGMTDIPPLCFYHCTGLKSVKFPSGLESIGERAFQDCESLRDAIIPDSIKSVGEKAFFSAGSFAEPELPSGCAVHPGAFDFTKDKPSGMMVVDTQGRTRVVDLSRQRLSDLNGRSGELRDAAKIILPEGMTLLETGSIRDCQSLASLELPASMRYIGPEAVERCPKLSDIIIKSDRAPEVPLGHGAYANEGYDLRTYDSMGTMRYGRSCIDPMPGCGANQVLKSAWCRTLLWDNANTPEALGRRIARSDMLETRKADREYTVALYPEQQGQLDMHEFEDCLRTQSDYDLMRKVTGGMRMAALEAPCRYRDTRDGITDDIDYLIAGFERKRVLFTAGVDYKADSKALSTATRRRVTSFTDSADLGLIPEPADWRSDMIRRVRFGVAAADCRGTTDAKTWSCMSRSSVAPDAASAYLSAAGKYAWYDKNAQGLEAVDIIASELAVESSSKAMGLKPGILITKSHDGRPGEPCGFYTQAAAELYIKECVSDRMDFNRDGLAFQCGREGVMRLQSVLSEAKSRPFGHVDGKVHDTYDTCEPMKLDAWAYMAGQRDGMRPVYDQYCNDMDAVKRGYAREKLADVRFRLPGGKATEPAVFYSRDVLLAYLSDMVSPDSPENAVSVRMPNPIDKNLAYDVHVAVKTAQGLEPDTKDAYLARCFGQDARQKPAARRLPSAPSISGDMSGPDMSGPER